MTLKLIIEALVFASQKPILPKEIVSALKSAAAAPEEDTLPREFARIKEPEVVAVLDQLKADYEGPDRAFRLVEQASGWHFVTAPECGRWVRQLYPESKPARLSGPALETLAIVAYRQPITKADIEAVRGVAVDGMMQTLLEKGLIRIGGRADVPGRPLLYETTGGFLEHFGLRTVDELPNAAELRREKLPTAPIVPVETTEASASEEPASESESSASAEESASESEALAGEQPQAASSQAASEQPPAGEAAPPTPAKSRKGKGKSAASQARSRASGIPQGGTAPEPEASEAPASGSESPASAGESPVEPPASDDAPESESASSEDHRSHESYKSHSSDAPEESSEPDEEAPQS